MWNTTWRIERLTAGLQGAVVADEQAAVIWLTVKQAAARAQVGPKLIYREVKAARLRAAHIGGRRDLRFLPVWIDSWLESSSTPVEIKR